MEGLLAGCGEGDCRQIETKVAAGTARRYKDEYLQGMIGPHEPCNGGIPVVWRVKYVAPRWQSAVGAIVVLLGVILPARYRHEPGDYDVRIRRGQAPHEGNDGSDVASVCDRVCGGASLTVGG